MKIRPVGVELFLVHRQTDGRTDGNDETKSRFSQFCDRTQCSSAAGPKVSPAATMNLHVQGCCNLPSVHDAQTASQPSVIFVSFVTVLRAM